MIDSVTQPANSNILTIAEETSQLARRIVIDMEFVRVTQVLNAKFRADPRDQDLPSVMSTLTL